MNLEIIEDESMSIYKFDINSQTGKNCYQLQNPRSELNDYNSTHPPLLDKVSQTPNIPGVFMPPIFWPIGSSTDDEELKDEEEFVLIDQLREEELANRENIAIQTDDLNVDGVELPPIGDQFRSSEDQQKDETEEVEGDEEDSSIMAKKKVAPPIQKEDDDDEQSVVDVSAMNKNQTVIDERSAASTPKKQTNNVAPKTKRCCF